MIDLRLIDQTRRYHVMERERFLRVAERCRVRLEQVLQFHLEHVRAHGEDEESEFYVEIRRYLIRTSQHYDRLARIHGSRSEFWKDMHDDCVILLKSRARTEAAGLAWMDPVRALPLPYALPEQTVDDRLPYRLDRSVLPQEERDRLQALRSSPRRVQW